MVSDFLLQVASGGIAGMVSATVTCPLDVVKTRLQSSSGGRMRTSSFHSTVPRLYDIDARLLNGRSGGVRLERSRMAVPRIMVVSEIRDIVAKEGLWALWKGLLPTLVGIVPSRAFYFSAYNEAKKKYELVFSRGSAPVHVLSAATSGFMTTTLANPIWMIRTRLQLDHGAGGSRLSTRECVRQIYAEYGLRGFLRGVTASYAGLSETVLHFGVYEELKSFYMSTYSERFSTNPQSSHFPVMMLFGGIARFIATCVSYPHEVIRTRLREKASLYHGFFRTLITVYRTESWRGLYSGITVHLMKTVPNSAVLMATYELTLSLLKEMK